MASTWSELRRRRVLATWLHVKYVCWRVNTHQHDMLKSLSLYREKASKVKTIGKPLEDLQ